MPMLLYLRRPSTSLKGETWVPSLGLRHAVGRGLRTVDEFSPLRSSNRTGSAHDRRDEAMHEITPCLWFDTEGEEAAKFYTSVFPNSRIVDLARYGSAGPRPEGTVMTVSFELGRAEVRRLERRVRVHVSARRSRSR